MVRVEKFVTKKILRKSVPKIRQIQARRMLRLHRRVSEAEIIDEAINYLERKELRTPTSAKHSILNICNFYKATGKKSNATEELDEVVYGSVHK